MPLEVLKHHACTGQLAKAIANRDDPVKRVGVWDHLNGYIVRKPGQKLLINRVRRIHRIGGSGEYPWPPPVFLKIAAEPDSSHSSTGCNRRKIVSHNEKRFHDSTPRPIAIP